MGFWEGSIGSGFADSFAGDASYSDYFAFSADVGGFGRGCASVCLGNDSWGFKSFSWLSAFFGIFMFYFEGYNRFYVDVFDECTGGYFWAFRYDFAFEFFREWRSSCDSSGCVV